MANPYYEKLLKCVDIVKGKIGGFEPKIALVLGSGLGPIAETMDVKGIIDYHDIEGFPVSTAPGQLASTTWGAVPSTTATPFCGRITPSRESGSPEHKISSVSNPAASA